MARIVVIGAGMAGLTAARRLSQGDHRLTVLEARDRVGGRVLSTTLENGAVVELGGEWLSTDQQAVIALAEELGLRLSPIGLNFAERDLIGAPHIPTEEHGRVSSLITRAIDALPHATRLRITVEDLLGDVDDRSDAFTVVRRRIEGSAAVPLDTLAVDEVMGDYGLEAASYLRVDKGNQAIAEAMAAQLADLRLNTPVDAIKSIGGAVEVGAGDLVMTADAVVVSVPLTLLARLRFEPPLEPALRRAIHSIAMGTAAKYAAPTEYAPDLLARQSGEEPWWCWTGLGSDGHSRRAITSFAGTQRAIDTISSDWRALLTNAAPEVALGDGSVAMDWGTEQWSLGCYSALGPGDKALLGAFDTVGPIVFAGEHTSGAGSIDGAIVSGEQAADRLATYLASSRTVP
ncbi:MAG: NAD(P)/FAD-dependent oxidoreductase [Acidimicrobiia bacterium]